MQMNEIIDGLSSCDFPASLPGANCNSVSGCGFGSWIWILLILFYTNQNNAQGGGGCCCKMKKKDCCCGNGGYGSNNAGYGSGCGGYLFLLVILFLCGGCGGCGGCGNTFGSGFDQGFDALGGCC